LVFSNWSVVPKVIASLASYEAERCAMLSFDSDAKNTEEARQKRRPLLRFSLSEGRLTGFPILGLLYPSITLAGIGDPLALRGSGGAATPNTNEVLGLIRQELEQKLRRVAPFTKSSGGIEDERWYWAAPMLLDLQEYRQPAKKWLDRDNLADVWSGELGDSDDESGESRWKDHVTAAWDLAQDPADLGRPPSDLLEVLATMALAGPAVTVARALSRVAGQEASPAASPVRDAAAKVAWAFRRLFNQPIAMAVIRGYRKNEEPYWRSVLQYCVDGVLPAVMDEYAHVLKDELGLGSKPWEETVKDIAGVMASVISLRTASLQVDDIRAPMGCTSVTIKGEQRMRSHFALRFGDQSQEDGGEGARREQVRKAFNSPFWPFVLATTSVGQEGLDFHVYCHAVVHWNLPANPVDLEQREGRIHRYKGHAVRKNLARVHAGLLHTAVSGDPWALMFEEAHRKADDASRDLVPFWVFPHPEGAHIERHVPTLPLSRDRGKYEALKRSLAIYRMVFGQPRQDDLLAYLEEHLDADRATEVAGEARIDLTPKPEPK
jgi:hypothetical protein